MVIVALLLLLFEPQLLHLLLPRLAHNQ
jgi:hypothetical protein